MIYNVDNYGALGDGTHNDTAAIQSAIDDCHKNGGGRVILSGGKTYRSGTLILPSYTELYLETGSVLKGSDNLEDYNVLGLHRPDSSKSGTPSYENCDYTGMPTLYFLYAKDSEYVSITGNGIIDGNEELFYGTVTPYHIDGKFYPRVPLVFMEHVSHLTLTGITLARSAFWTTHLVGCEDVLISGIRILNNLRMANCDGIDPDHCKNVRITDCHIECADDCIVFKNTAAAMQYGACENIVVNNCTLISTSAAIKFGTESEAPFRNITVSNCCISRSNRGIALQLRDKGCIENVTFSNLTIDTRLFSREHFWGKAEPVSITALPRTASTQVGYIRNVLFHNIHCTSENGIVIYGNTTRNISDISFDHVDVRLCSKTHWEKNTLDIRPCEKDGLRSCGLTGIYARNAERITFGNWRLDVDASVQDVFAKETDIDDCENIKINVCR